MVQIMQDRSSLFLTQEMAIHWSCASHGIKFPIPPPPAGILNRFLSFTFGCVAKKKSLSLSRAPNRAIDQLKQKASLVFEAEFSQLKHWVSGRLRCSLRAAQTKSATLSFLRGFFGAAVDPGARVAMSSN